FGQQHQVREQLRGAAGRFVGEQAVEQLTDAQNALAQLAQAKHQTYRDAMFVEVRIDGRRRDAAAVQPALELVQRKVQRAAVTAMRQQGAAQGVHVGGQTEER